MADILKRDEPDDFEAWWQTHPHKNRELANYTVKKQIAWDAWYARSQAARTMDDAPDARPWHPHLDYAGEPMKPGEFRDPPDAQADRSIILEMAAATAEQEMWERRFGVLYRSHPSWRSADNDGSWGLRDFLAYVGDICGFDTRAVLATKEGE